MSFLFKMLLFTLLLLLFLSFFAAASRLYPILRKAVLSKGTYLGINMFRFGNNRYI